MFSGRTADDTVWTLVERRARLAGEERLVTFVDGDGPDETTTWAAVAGRAVALAGRLAGLGVRPGERVALFGANSVDYVVALFGVARLGAVCVPLNALLTAPEIAWQLADAGAVALLGEAGAAARLDEAAARSGFSGPRVAFRGEAPGWLALDGGGPPPDLPSPPGPDDLFEILYTSGTTGHPKGVMLSHRSMASEGDSVASYWAARPDDVFLGVLPLFHVNAQLVTMLPALVSGARLALARSFSAGGWIDLVRRHGVTISSIVGTQVRMIMATPERPDDADTALRVVPYGLNVPPAMWTAFERRFGAPLCNIYGLTEAVAVATCAPLHGDRRIPSVGRPGRGRAVGIFDDDGKEVPPGAEGEIRIRGERGVSLMVGYHGRPEETAAAFSDAWLRTGDLGRVDEDGYLYFVDRAKDVIKRSGENVSASEVERVLSEFPGVAEAAVVGRPDDMTGEAVCAFVVLKQARPSGAEGEKIAKELRDWVGKEIGPIAKPKDIRFGDNLPKTRSGKIMRRLLRSIAKGEAITQDVSTLENPAILEQLKQAT
ncbi:MAG TPA: AMP-binding protein [Acidimicrobiia bacterium]|nr:AMP-binding protein [Acidimicrobiia bacterium]